MGVPVTVTRLNPPLTPAKAGFLPCATLPQRCPDTALFREVNAENQRRRAPLAGTAGFLGRVFGALWLVIVGGITQAQPIPDAAPVMRCYQAIEARVRAWGAPGSEPIEDPPEATGATLTLRLGGRVIGRGVSFADAGHNVARAFDEAWAEAESSLIVEKDALADERRLTLAARITTDLEISGALRPLVGATFEAAAMALSPGLDGVAIREGDRITGVFPGTQLATGLLPDRAMRVAAGKLGLPPTDLDRMRRDHDLTLYSFRTQHLAQARPGGSPQFLQRGGTYVPLANVTGANLRATADAIASHLLTHAWTGPEAYGLRGDYHPTSGLYEPLIGEPMDQALVAFALARYAQTPGVNAETGARSTQLARTILHDLTVIAADEADLAADPVASAMWLAGWMELIGVEPTAREDAEFGAFSTLALGAVRKGIDSSPAWNSLAPGAKALVAYALVRVGAAGLDADAAARARTIMGELLSGATPAQLASLMPWILWAELEASPGERVPAELALRDFRSLTWEFQVEESPAQSANADLSGGIVFTRGGMRLPTWQTLRPLAAIATMVGNPTLTSEDELALEVAAVRRSMRFLMQLAIREGELSMVQSERRAIGGVRLALWDQTEGLDANATGLLAVCELLRSVAARSGR